MSSRGCRIRRMLKCGLIAQEGINVIKKRFKEGEIPLDAFGEPIGPASGFFAEETIRIVVVTDKRQVEEAAIGGLPEDDSKEVLHFQCAGDEDIKTGDKIIYPKDTENEWIIFFVLPNIQGGVNVLVDAKCHRDRRY